MGKIKYTKPALSYSDQVTQLIQRGLIVNDLNFAESILRHVNYYRLSAYMHPFLLEPKINHVFKPNTSFEIILNLYSFDKALRLLIFDHLEKIEVSVRTTLIYKLSHKYDPFWICNSNLFIDQQKYDTHVKKLSDEINRSDEKFLKHYTEKYSEKIPPTWICLETISFGLLSQVIKNLNFKDRKTISKVYDLEVPVFTSWLHNLNYIRNICAHHSRLWNRTTGITPANPKFNNNWVTIKIRQDKLFFSLCIISHFLNHIENNRNFVEQLSDLLKRYSQINPTAMGFPLDWQNEPLFKY